MSDAQLPLDGVVILALEQFGAGPWATLQLADLGADVIKIEDPASGGDVARYVPPYQEGEDSLYFETFNRGKRSISLDLRLAEGRAAFEDLVRGADAVFSNLRGDKPVALGLTYAQLAPVNPRIVCCSLSGHGMTGPRAATGAYDYILQGLAGWMTLTGAPDDPPTKTGPSLVDFGAGYVAAIAMLGGLLHARATGRGCDCDISLHETALALTTYVATWVASRGYKPTRMARSAHPSIVPFQNFPSADGWIVIACPKERFWRALCSALELTDLLADPRAHGFAARAENREWLEARLSERLRERTTAEWITRLEAAEVPCGPVNDMAAALADPQVAARGGISELDHPRLGRVRAAVSPLRVGAAPRAAAAGPGRGEHTQQILAERCGYDDAHLAHLQRAGVFG
jgi:crotonobetainyl-CoA:carnitine CoA-transferase CaiB-like acyl-CoA transferase